MMNQPIFSKLNVKRWLEEINHFILHDQGEIIEGPGKISLVWIDAVYDEKRYLAIKLAGEDHVIINGHRFPATEQGIKKGLITSLQNSH